MTALLLAIAVALAVATALVRRSRRRRAADLAEILEAVHAARSSLPEGATLAPDDGAVAVRSADGDARLSHDRLLAALRRGHSPEAVAEAALDLLSRPWEALDGPFGLKTHSTRLQIALISGAQAALLPRRRDFVQLPLDDLPLIATYRLDGRPDACLTLEHLRSQGIDTRDLHGIGLAVLRQRFDAELVERLASGEGPQVVESRDGTATAAVLVLSDFLAPDQRVDAVLESPDRLVLYPVADDARSAGADRPGVLGVRIDARGRRIL